MKELTEILQKEIEAWMLNNKEAIKYIPWFSIQARCHTEAERSEVPQRGPEGAL